MGLDNFLNLLEDVKEMSEDELSAQVTALKPELLKHTRKSLIKGDTW